MEKGRERRGAPTCPGKAVVSKRHLPSAWGLGGLPAPLGGAAAAAPTPTPRPDRRPSPPPPPARAVRVPGRAPAGRERAWPAHPDRPPGWAGGGGLGTKGRRAPPRTRCARFAPTLGLAQFGPPAGTGAAPERTGEGGASLHTHEFFFFFFKEHFSRPAYSAYPTPTPSLQPGGGTRAGPPS